jgi:hypothetical protein
MSTTVATTTPTSTAAASLVEGYLRVHRYLEDTTAALASATAALRPDDQDGAAGLQRAWRRLASAVEHHHRTHHEIVLAAVADIDPALAEHLGGLEQRHGRLRAKARAVTTSLGWLVSGWRDRRAGTPEAVPATRALASELRAHLAEEEAVVLPRLAALDHDEAAALADRIERCHSGAEALPFALVTGAVSLADLPVGLRLAARAVLVPRYERDLAPLSGDALGR